MREPTPHLTQRLAAIQQSLMAQHADGTGPFRARNVRAHLSRGRVSFKVLSMSHEF
jgi:hypothetical protein